MNDKKGSSLFILPIVLFLIILFLIIFFKLIIDLILPFIYYQKLDLIASKYMFVIEKFGYLTNLEKNNLINELSNKGFDKSLISLEYPNVKKDYGELIEFHILYKYKINEIKFFNIKEKYINIKVNKNSFSKI